MKNFEIVESYLAKKYPNRPYAMREGNDCVWVSMGHPSTSMGLVEMYFIVKNNVITDIQVD